MSASSLRTASSSRATRARHQRFERFASSFLHPLLSGGSALIDRPLPASDLEHFALARSADGIVDQETFEAMHRHARALLPGLRLPYPDRNTLALTMAGYDLLWLTDPCLDRLFARNAILRVKSFIEGLLEGVEAPESLEEAVARHVVVDRLLALRRTDVQVESWVSKHRFDGRVAPWNVLAWPKLRRVQQSAQERSLLEVLQQADALRGLGLLGLLRRLLARSPITALLRPQVAGRFDWGRASLALVGNDRLRGALARELVRKDFARFAPYLEAANARLLRSGAPAEAIAAGLSLSLEALLLDALDARSTHAPARLLNGERSPFVAALLPLSFEPASPLETRLAMLQGLHPNDRERASQAASALARAIAPEAMDAVRDGLRRALQKNGASSASPFEPNSARLDS